MLVYQAGYIPLPIAIWGYHIQFPWIQGENLKLKPFVSMNFPATKLIDNHAKKTVMAMATSFFIEVVVITGYNWLFLWDYTVHKWGYK